MDYKIASGEIPKEYTKVRVKKGRENCDDGYRTKYIRVRETDRLAEELQMCKEYDSAKVKK